MSMDYKVLYRKYRPNDFENVVDQDYIITILNNAIKNNKISHAYIFSGPRGTGKTSTARIFAKAVNCLNPGEKGPCGECEMCLGFNKNADIIELDAASNNGVDEIREIIDNVKIAPSYSKFKVYIIDEVHMLTQSAFNALLLTLEEPPSNVIFIMATTNIENVPVTILSRCQRFDFKRIRYEALVDRLKYVCEQEVINITDEAIGEIAKLSDGGMRDALSILDQVQQENLLIDLETIQKIYGIVPNKLIEALVGYLNEYNIDKTLEVINTFQDLGLNYKSLVKSTINVLRECSIEALKNREYDKYNRYKHVILELNRTINEANVYINPYILYELAFLNNLCQSENIQHNVNENIANKVGFTNSERNETLINGQNYFPGNNFEESQLFKKKNVRINNCFVNPQKDILNDIKTKWSNFIENITNNQILSLIVDAFPVAASNKIIMLSVNSTGTAELINLDTKKIEKEIQKYYNKEYQIVALTKEEWDNYRNKYILDIKKGIKYNYMDEPEESSVILEDVEDFAKNIFKEDKIEIV